MSVGAVLPRSVAHHIPQSHGMQAVHPLVASIGHFYDLRELNVEIAHTSAQKSYSLLLPVL